MTSRISTHKIYPVQEVPAMLLDTLTADNPEYTSRLRRGASTRGIPPKIELWYEKDGEIYIPRSVQTGIPVRHDGRAKGTPQQFNFLKELRPHQVPAVKDLIRVEGGILEAGCGTGKTVMSLYSVAQVGTTTLILVHKEFLLNQWVERIKEFLGEDAGVVRGDKWDWQGKKIVVGMLQTLYNRRDSLPEGFKEYFGLVISDEVHRVAADTWSYVVTMFPAFRRWGLTATIKRTDGLQTVFLAHIGPVVHTLKAKELKPKVYKIGMNYDFNVDKYRQRYGNQDINIPSLVTAITKIQPRNNLIVKTTLDAAKSGRKIIVFSERVEHLNEMCRMFNELGAEHGVTGGLFHGKIKQDERDRVAEECEVLFATYQIAKEALDIPELDTAILASPVSNPITIQQGVGRITREHPAKKDPMVIHFVDNGIEVCVNMFRKCCTVYNKLGYPVITAKVG